MRDLLMYEFARRFAAVSTAAGLRGPPVAATDRLAPVIASRGTADPSNPYAGGREDGWRLGVDETVELIVGDGVDVLVPHTWERITSTVWRDRSGSQSGEAAVTQYSIVDGGHTWPGGTDPERALLSGQVEPSADASALMGEFFAPHIRRIERKR
jgi:polyhydroxybutyrate depolymerase